MINKKQKKLNNKELALSAGTQLGDARKKAGFLLSEVAKYYNYSQDDLDAMESGTKLYPLHEMSHIAAIYNKKIEIKIVDA